MKSFSYKTPLVCNQKCSFCVTSAKFIEKTYEIPLKKVIKDFLILKKKGYTHISIEGGEPTIVTNLPDIVRVGNKMNIKISIISNGLQCDHDILEKLYAAGLRDITFSLHSHNKIVHDRLVEVDGAFVNIHKSIRDAIDLGFIVSINSVICKENQEELAEMIDYMNVNFPGLMRISFCNIEANITHESDYEEKSKLFPDLDIIKKSIQSIQADNVMIDNLPLCVFGKEKLHYAVQSQRDDNDTVQYEGGNLKQLNFKVKLDACRECILEERCKGVFPYFKKNFDLITPFK